MDNYTESLASKIYEIRPWDDNYYQDLIAVAKSFRRFDEALDEYIASHGYKGALNDIDSKIHYLKEKFERADIPVPRNLKKWYLEHKPIERITAIQLCFAFDLSMIESEDFLRRICLQRSFDCHDSQELVYYFAIAHHLKYRVAKTAIDKLELSVPTTFNVNENAVYTSMIMEEVNGFKDLNDVVSYIRENGSQFGYNNATASKYIITLWDEIAGTSGIAKREEKIYSMFDGDKSTKEGVHETKRSAAEKSKNASLWEVYLQILGLRGKMIKTLKNDRSLKPILKNNQLLHPLAEYAFPDRDGITKVLNGNHVSDERVRKILILLAFYKYWGLLAVKRGKYEANYGDADRCYVQINNYLSDAGYPLLYSGNPFDWLIMYWLEDGRPLQLFRDFMQEVFYIKQNSEVIAVRHIE